LILINPVFFFDARYTPINSAIFLPVFSHRDQ